MLVEIETFVRIVDLRNIAAAADELNISPQSARRRLHLLEDRIGIKLIDRSSRCMAPTEAGVMFYLHAVNIVEAAEAARTSMVAERGGLGGNIRIAAPLAYGRKILAPLIPSLSALHPELKIRLRLSDHNFDLLSAPIDMAVRAGPMPDSTLVTRKIVDCPRILCASPGYLARIGRPKEPAGLADHDCLVLRTDGERDHHWTLSRQSTAVRIPVEGKIDADDSDAIIGWTLEGMGISAQPLWEIREYLRAGQLIEVLPGWSPTPQSLHLLYPSRNLLPRKVQLLADSVVRHTRAMMASFTPANSPALDQNQGFTPLRMAV
jgi:DNA-binding transcriptional LysR family regulator